MEYHIIKNHVYKLYRNKIAIDRDEDVPDVGYDSDEEEKKDELIVDDGSVVVNMNDIDETLNELTPLQIAQASPQVNDPINQFSFRDEKICNDDIKDHRLIIKHRAEAKNANAKHNDMIDDIDDKDMVIVDDAKQNDVIGHCPEESHYLT